jgi:hypothetical protein
VHHALLLGDVLGVGRDIDNNWIVFWKTSLEVGFLPFELFVFGIWDGDAIVISDNRVISACVLISPGKAEEL